MMNARGVMVSCSVAGSSTVTNCSGILLDNNWVLTTGSILSSVLHHTSNFNIESQWENLLKNIYPTSLIRIPNKLLQNTQISFSVLCPYASGIKHLDNNNMRLDTLSQVSKTLMKYIPKYQCSKEIISIKNNTSPAVFKQESQLPNSLEKIKECKSDLRYIWKSALVIQAVDALISSWILGTTSSGKDGADNDAGSEIIKNLLPMFLIIKLGRNNHCESEREERDQVVNLLSGFSELEEDILRRGRMVAVESTPFGNPFFYNSVSEGIVSNVVGPGNCLLLTDARTALGCEGGPIFILTERNNKPRVHLVGMVVSSLSWWRGEWVGFTLGVTLKAAFQHCILENKTPTYHINPTRPSSNTTDELAFLDDCLVLVRCGEGWGSGIVIDAHKGIILTCSHVVRKAHNNVIQICWKNLKKPAKLLFRSRDGIPYDVAVLQVDPVLLDFQSASLSSRIPVKGEPVIAAGFPLFSEDDNSRPTVTRGIVAHVSNPVAMLQTTCCVQSGASGGAIFWTTGELVGLISCNTQDVTSGALYPHINMAVPICALKTHLADFVKTGDVQYLKHLECPDPVIQRIWKLRPLNSKL